MSNRGYTLDADSMRLLSKLVRESGLINKDNRIARIVDSWPTCAPARVTEEITARDGDTLGKGIVHVLVAQNVVDDNDTYEIAKQSELDPVDIPVFNLFENKVIPVDKEGFIIQDQRGAHWWLETGGGSRRANAVLDADMLPTDDFVSVVSIEPIEGEGDTEPIDAANVCRWYGITGNKCKIEYNPNFDNGVDPETEEPLPPGGWELYAIEINYTLECPVIEVEE
jgi:hypothetical protein